MKNNVLVKIAIWMSVGLALYLLFKQFDEQGAGAVKPIQYSAFLEQVKDKRIKEVIIDDRTILATATDGQKYKTGVTYLDRGLIGDLVSSGVSFDIRQPEQPSFLGQLFVSWFPMLLLIGVWVFFMKQMQGNKGGPFSFGRSKARMLDENVNAVTFKDVAGCDEAKAEVTEVVDFLRDPTRFQKLGGRIPRGMLLVGPPGTGKTLLAKAIAGEAKVPFFTISGSDFVEMFVGVGAARMRDMFDNAKKHAPCIIFVDEIDAVGRHRGSGTGGGNDEREQTLNQMLVEMDGFDSNSGVIVVAATNRADVLDKALLRPGRFDRQVMVGLPDVRGRQQILEVHMRKVPLGSDVKAEILARGTQGFSGADLANLVNESALMAARFGKERVEMLDFEQAKDKIFMGPERRSMIMSEDERKSTAYHESGHAVVAKLLPKADPVHKVTIMPRGFALGLTWQLPEADRISLYRDKMLQDISILFGGRVAEEVFLDQMSSGASNDFERATKMARTMVTRYGMSDSLGTMVYEDNDNEAAWSIKPRAVSEATQQKIDAEIRMILDTQYALTRRLIEENRDKIEAMTAALLEFETLDADQVEDIMQGRVVRAPKIQPQIPTSMTPPSGGSEVASSNPLTEPASDKPAPVL